MGYGFALRASPLALLEPNLARVGFFAEISPAGFTLPDLVRRLLGVSPSALSESPNFFWNTLVTSMEEGSRGIGNWKVILGWGYEKRSTALSLADASPAWDGSLRLVPGLGILAPAALRKRGGAVNPRPHPIRYANLEVALGATSLRPLPHLQAFIILRCFSVVRFERNTGRIIFLEYARGFWEPTKTDNAGGTTGTKGTSGVTTFQQLAIKSVLFWFHERSYCSQCFQLFSIAPVHEWTKTDNPVRLHLMIVSLNYHRRHGKHCEGKHPVESFTSEPEERRKGWIRCKCPITASGSLQRIHKRVATKQTDWAAAAALMAPYLAQNSWADPQPPPPSPEPPAPGLPPAEGTNGVSVATATKAYLQAHKDANSAEATIRLHGYSTAKILNLSQRLGATTLDQWTSGMVRQLLAEASVSSASAKTQLNRYKAFFNWCCVQKWITVNPAKLPGAINNREKKQIGHTQKFPFTNEELESMYAACKRYGSFPSFTRIWTGEDLEDFIAVSVHTGLRISDVATFHIDRLKGNDEVHVRTTKSGAMVYTVVPEWLADRIRARARKVGPFIFGGHKTTIVSVYSCEWRNRLNKVWELCGPWKVAPTPHRFRHTFARILLEDDNSPSRVAELMGNTEVVVREYYSAWMPSRQEETSKRLRKAFANVPTPNSPRKPKVVPLKRQA